MAHGIAAATMLRAWGATSGGKAMRHGAAQQCGGPTSEPH